MQESLKDWYEFHLLQGLNGNMLAYRENGDDALLPSDPKASSRVELFLRTLQASVIEESSPLGLSPAALGVHIPSFIEQANVDLKKYLQFPLIARDPVSSEWTVEMRHKVGDAWENGAIDAVLQLLRDKELWRLRRCEFCRKWLYAVRSDKRFCDHACRQKEHSQSKEHKKKRADYMRDRYRPLQKQLEHRAQRGLLKLQVGK